MLDLLYARVLVLEAGKKLVALVSPDLGRAFPCCLLDQLCETAARRYELSFLIVTAFDTHSGPDIFDAYPNDRVPAWVSTDLEKIESAIGVACGHLATAQLAAGYSIREAFVGFNRRRVNEDGTVATV